MADARALIQHVDEATRALGFVRCPSTLSPLGAPSRFEACEPLDRATAVQFDPASSLEGRVGVHHVDGRMRRCVSHEPCRGIDLQRRPHDDDHIGRSDHVHGCVNQGNRFAEPHDVRTQLRPIGPDIAKVQLRSWQIEDHVFAPGGTCFPNFPVQMHHARAACPLVEVVHVLGDNVHVEQRFQP